MKLAHFNESLLYSNKNVEKLARKLINESCNATLMEMFDDKCIIADHTTGQIYECNYKFDGNTFNFSNFSEIELEKDDNSLREAINDFFDDKDVNLAEAYESAVVNKSDVFESSLAEALASKNMDNVINYSELEGINKEVDLSDVKSLKLFEERLANKPTSSIKMFNWKDDVNVSLIDEDENNIVSKSMVEKASKLKSNYEFKNSLVEAASNAIEGDKNLLEELVNENQSIVSLDKAGLKELVGISVIGNKELMENRNNIVNMIENIISEDEELSAKKDAFEGEEPSKEADTPEASEEDVEAVKKALETAKNKAKDEKLIDKIEKLIDSLDTAKDSGETDVGAMKESIEILSL